MAITRSEHIQTASGDVHINLHRHDGPGGTCSLGVSSFGSSFMDFGVHLARADMLALAGACLRMAEGPDNEGIKETAVAVKAACGDCLGTGFAEHRDGGQQICATCDVASDPVRS